MERDVAASEDLVRLFTDGACSGNPGPGGWAFILHHPASGRIAESSGAELATTNNRMELMGVIEGLTTLKKPCQVELITDSQYVAKGITDWMPNWKRQGWMRKEGGRLKPVINLDLWQKLDSLLTLMHHSDPCSGTPRSPRERGLRPDGGRGLQGYRLTLSLAPEAPIRTG